MTINTSKDGQVTTISLEGRLDTTTAPDLEKELDSVMAEDVSDLIFDLGMLDYISSAGLRVLLSAQKSMNKKGSMEIRGASEDIMEIFEVTGFVDIFTIV